MNKPYQVLPYSIDQLLKLLSESYKPKFGDFEASLHSIYFEKYLKTIDALTIIVESDYIDRDFLDDYASYYVKCFHQYERTCRRIHFFSIPITKKKFDSLLTRSSNSFLKKLQDSYLGFIVVKPLPKTILGRTCLKTYPEEQGRSFPVTRTYTVNLFGINLKIESLGYQEQDQVVAACATSALWSAFQGTGVLFHHRIPTPIEITRAATNNYLAERRNLPNKGLDIEQMAQAIRTVGLEPFNVNVDNFYNLTTTIYSYLKGGVPVLLVVKLYDFNKGTAIYRGLHAVTVTGFCLNGNLAKKFLESEFNLRSSQLEKIYAHDDQVGPFARMEIDSKYVTLKEGRGKPKSMHSLSTSWTSEYNTDLGFVRAVPTAVLVPLYNKIRIPFEVIHSIILDANRLLQPLVSSRFGKSIIWDIYLSTINSFKENILQSKLSPKFKKDILVEGMPRFIWRAIANIDDEPVVEFIFDATDIEQGNIFLRNVPYDENFSLFLQKVLKSAPPTIQNELLSGAPSSPIFEWLLKH